MELFQLLHRFQQTTDLQQLQHSETPTTVPPKTDQMLKSILQLPPPNSVICHVTVILHLWL